jgi:4-amino-4-deoxy-L-arabinose transferase-like glycosyltransferase
MFQNRTSGWILVLIIFLAIFTYLWGIERNLPYTREVDEDQYVERAVKMAATGDLNPGWFGNPGSTVIYPLAFMYRFSNAIITQSSPFRNDPDLLKRFEVSFWQFYLMGRLLTVTYSVLSIPLIYLIGKRFSNSWVGLGGAFLFVLYVPVVYYTKMVRTDSSALFFGLLSLWLCLKVLERPNALNQFLAGSSIGLSIASRYFMVTLIPVFLTIDILIVWRQRSKALKEIPWIPITIGLFSVLLAFAISTPYFFLEFPVALENIGDEARTTHLGADGLTKIGNLLWYFSYAIPTSITWPQALLAAIGSFIILARRKTDQLLLLAFVLVFLVGISLTPLHWRRWVIQILPIISLIVAYALYIIAQSLKRYFKLTSDAQAKLFVFCILLLAVWPGRQVVLLDLQDSLPSTRVVARNWIINNLPPESRIAQEWYTAPLDDTVFKTYIQFSLASDRNLKDYYLEGFEYLMVSSDIYDRYLEEPERYADEVNFYNTLFTESTFVKIFEPSNFMGGPTIRIYKISDEKQVEEGGEHTQD